MKFRTSGEIRRVDLEPVLTLLPALREEWAGLVFAPGGGVVNPLSGEEAPGLVLVSGRHRQVGAVYRVTVETLRSELPEDRREEFDLEAADLRRRRAGQAEWEAHHRRQRDASVPAGVEQVHYELTLRHDDVDRLVVGVTDESGWWAVEVDIEHLPLPRVALTGRLDLTSVLRATGSPGCLASLLGGRGETHAVVESGPLGLGPHGPHGPKKGAGEVIRADGRVNRFRGRGSVKVRSSGTRWQVRGTATLRARGLGRLVLLAAGWRIRAAARESSARFWAQVEAGTRDVEETITRLAGDVEAAGGPSPYVRRVLWDPSFTHPPSWYRNGPT